jgi:hypothetical protein
MYLGERVLEETIVFYAQCQDTDGSAINAAAGPTYSVYEEETGAPIVAAGTAMAKLGAELGLYSEELALAAGTGFQDDAWYVIRITGTVDGETPASTHTFKIMPASTPAAVADAVWDEAKAGHQGETIMGNIAEDLDAMETTVEEG